MSDVHEVVCAFLGFEFVQNVADVSPERFAASRLGVPQPVLELGEHLLDWIEGGAVGRREQKMVARASYRRAHRFGPVATQIVHDDDVAAAEVGISCVST